MGANLSYFYFCVVSLADWYRAILTIFIGKKLDFNNQTKQKQKWRLMLFRSLNSKHNFFLSYNESVFLAEDGQNDIFG